VNSKQTEYNVDHFGVALMSVTSCRKCGYRHSDVISVEKRDPIHVSARISSLADLNIKVIKSGTATITIPEFGVTITPGTYGEGFVTNVEGVLRKVEDVLNFMLSSADDKCLRRGEMILKRLRLSRESKPCFTLIIEDPLGNSDLVFSDPSKIERRRLTECELRKVKFGQYALDSTESSSSQLS
jgi:zinc finger protein